MILKIIKTTHNFCLISILIFCFSQNRALSASKEPIISVLILKDKKIKGLTLKKQNNRTTLIFDKNKQKIYDLKNKEKFLVRSSDRRGIWVGQKRYAGKLNIFISDNHILVVNVLGIE